MPVFFVVSNESHFARVYDLVGRDTPLQRLVMPVKSFAGSTRAAMLCFQAARQARCAVKLLAVVMRGGKNAVIVSSAVHYSALVAAKVARMFGLPTKVFLFNYYIHGMGKRPAVQAILKFLLRGDIGIIVQSQPEVEYFRSLAPHADVTYHPYCLAPLTFLQPEDVRDDGYVFAGGYTNRDYDTLVRSARMLPDIHFVIACSAANRIDEPLPPNVEVVLGLGYEDFHRRMAAGRIVVVPLKENVGSSGQMVALAGMQLGKPVVYADFPAVGQYFSSGDVGVPYVPGDADSLAGIVRALDRDDAARMRIGGQARAVATRDFSVEAFESAVVKDILRFIHQEHSS